MKNKVWLLQVPAILFFTSAFVISELGNRGELFSKFLTVNAYPLVSIVTGLFTNAKFHLRGPMPPKNKIVILDIDNESLSNPELGRWPWRRDRTAKLIQRAFESGAKIVGLDIVFSEPNRQITDELASFLKERKLDENLDRFETDLQLRDAVTRFQDRLALGWMPDGACQPAYNTPDTCPAGAPEVIQMYPPEMVKFGVKNHILSKDGFSTSKTPVLTATAPIINIPIYNQAAKYAGHLGIEPDMDGFIRRASLFYFGAGSAFPVLGFEMARMALGEEIEFATDSRSRIESIRFSKSGREIPVSHLSVMEINFRGPAYTFPYVSAQDVVGPAENVRVTVGNVGELRPRSEVFKDALVLVGLSALGVYDIRAFPFDTKTPGVEGHATILDNFLANDMLTRGPGWAAYVMLGLMLVGGTLFGFGFSLLEALPSLGLIVGTLGLLILCDLKLLFANNINFNTSFLYLELLAIAVITFAAKYVLEERNKKFIRGAFSKYVAPAIVDSILKDPSKLQVGGDRKELSILFSDIRGFTTFSERLDAKKLAQFLNDYLGIMTDLVFDNEGTLDKYIGDAVMAFWGAPLDQPLHALNACKAAVRMQQVLAENRKRFSDQYGVDVQIGIGINSGIVNVGNMGSERIFEYTVIGDHVNLASRLEGLTKYYGAGIVTTRFTFDCIAAAGQTPPPHRVLDSVKVKGKKNAVELIEVLTRDLSSDGLEAFAQGRALYAQKRWFDAIEAFQKANELLRPSSEGVDGPSQMFIERCNELKDSPPDADWDGSWEMHSK